MGKKNSALLGDMALQLNAPIIFMTNYLGMMPILSAIVTSKMGPTDLSMASIFSQNTAKQVVNVYLNALRTTSIAI
ncbi:hypothetical protein DESPIG_00377 [Desulfovibrio piger ATCC 29098]|uniref:Uncharacterized protein n=1 Tax=Desulfovibrio piger ATCC 29098 TaxID=411464 RepID=B6WQQ1_9BACT|nr:hypothetical protein DESPIG_00377 [Desulfovibrio piger ATCC 29098]